MASQPPGPAQPSNLIDQVARGQITLPQALRTAAARNGGVDVPSVSAGPRDPAGPPVSPERETSGSSESVTSILAELDALVGLDRVKRTVREIAAYLEVRQRRVRLGLRSEFLVLHMAFKGNPGTGKTTVARLIGRLFRAMGLLPKGHMVEVERADLVGEFVGHTAQRTREQIRRAMGGVLFVDEAYSLARGGEKDFGREAVDVLVKAMEDHRHELVVILAGYRQEMEYFLHLNPGLSSRVPFLIDFPDFSGEELLVIADQMVKARDYLLSPEARERLGALLWHYRLAQWDHFGNARLVRNLVEAAVRRQALRLANSRATPLATAGRTQLMTLKAEDFPVEDDGA